MHCLGEGNRSDESERDGTAEELLQLDAETLRGMEADGLVQRHVHKLTAPQHIEYALTELGMSLEAPLAAICAWAVNHPAEPQPATPVVASATRR